MRKILFIILFVFSIGNAGAQATSDSIVMNYLKEMGAPVTYNNEVKLLMTGHDKFVDLFENIRHARHHIHLEYFNFRNDSIANALFSLLAEKAKEGVEVRAMVRCLRQLVQQPTIERTPSEIHPRPRHRNR